MKNLKTIITVITIISAMLFMASCGNTPECEHDYKIVSQKDATCTGSGNITYQCEKCADRFTLTTPATGHLYYTTVVPRTFCNEEAGNLLTCIYCGDSHFDTNAANYHAEGHSFVRDTIELSVLGAEFVNYVFRDTCTECGGIEYHLSTSEDVIDDVTHYYASKDNRYVAFVLFDCRDLPIEQHAIVQYSDEARTATVCWMKDNEPQTEIVDVDRILTDNPDTPVVTLFIQGDGEFTYILGEN